MGNISSQILFRIQGQFLCSIESFHFCEHGKGMQYSNNRNNSTLEFFFVFFTPRLPHILYLESALCLKYFSRSLRLPQLHFFGPFQCTMRRDEGFFSLFLFLFPPIHGSCRLVAFIYFLATLVGIHEMES